MPSGRGQVVITESRDEPLVVGPKSQASTVPTASLSAGVAFTGAGFGTLCRLPVVELVNQDVDADVVWPNMRWDDCFADGHAVGVLDRLESQMIRLLRSGPQPNSQVLAAEQAIRRGATLDSVAARVGADRRRLVPVFRNVVGFGPKHYQRLVRFQRVLREMRTTSPASITQLAIAHGYADQSHLTREFREFAGMTPGRLHGQASLAHNHVIVGSDAPGSHPSP